MELTEPDILLLKYLSRYAIADIECIKSIYAPYGNKRYYAERLAKLKDKSNKYIAVRNKQSVYALLKNGKKLLKEMGSQNPTWYSGNKNSFRRLETVSKTAALLMKAGVNVLDDIIKVKNADNTFIPSMLVKSQVLGIDRQSRFTGILYIPAGNYAVYDLGDGSRVWQPLSEYSLFKDGLRNDWKLDGMLFLADEGSIMDIASKTIITDIIPGRLTSAVKSVKNPLRLWPGYKSCCLWSKNEAAFMVKLLKKPNWRYRVIADLFTGAELLGGSLVDPDCKYMNALIFLMMDNDLLRAHLLRNYFNACSSSKEIIHLYCLESHTAVYATLFPELRIVPVRISRLERILEMGCNSL